MLFTVKICGLTTPGDAALAAAAGADAVGLNFVAGSPRVLGVDAAQGHALGRPRPLEHLADAITGFPEARLRKVAT